MFESTPYFLWKKAGKRGRVALVRSERELECLIIDKIISKRSSSKEELMGCSILLMMPFRLYSIRPKEAGT